MQRIATGDICVFAGHGDRVGWQHEIGDALWVAAAGNVDDGEFEAVADQRIVAVQCGGQCRSADVADQLLELATHSENDTWRRWALRAYIRVVTLESDRPEAETLAMLQRAMSLAGTTDDRQLTLERAATIRAMPTVDWIASYLDDPELNQVACEAIVELAHHRFLRHPNMDQFGPILDRVGQISKDAGVVERAKRYRLGL